MVRFALNKKTKTRPQWPEEVAAEIRRRQQMFLVRQVPTIAAVNFINGSLTALIFWGMANPFLTSLWFIAIAAGSLLQFLGWLRIAGKPTPAVVSGRSFERAKGWSWVMGGVWGAANIVLFTPDSIPHQMFLGVVIAGMCAGTVSFLNPLPQLGGRFVIAALGPFVIVYGATGQPLQMAIAMMGLVFGATIVRGSIHSHHQFVGMVASSFEASQAKTHLANAIEATNDAFAIFDQTRALVLANSRFSAWFPNPTEAFLEPGDNSVRLLKNGLWVQGSIRPIPDKGYVCVYTDVSELKRREQDLVRANQEAEEANRAKSDFLANMSHELRTPLNAIIGFSDVMKGEMFGELKPRYKDYANDILVSATHLLSIITDILDLSRIESATYRIEPEEVDVRDALQWVVNLARGQPKFAERDITVEVTEGAERLFVDLRAFKQVVLNLANNALKFTPEDGKVGIRAELTSSGEAAVRVWDTGIGIPADKIDHVRKPFQQAEGVFHRKYQGTGLGLSISSALVELHGGRMEIESVVDQGTTVSALFPPERVRPSARQRRVA
ncbi:MAG: hypothetical protein GC199_04780 [Alphaproteobacteria bacterium]|nr:hypothetical protein [Alphaproteobacteria bacterium]